MILGIAAKKDSLVFWGSRESTHLNSGWEGSMTRYSWAGVAVGLFLLLQGGAWGQDAPIIDPDDPIRCVQADWRIQINSPDATNSTPQVSLILSPFPHLNSWFTELTLNSWKYAPNQGGSGGLMVRIFQGTTLYAAGFAKHGVKLNATGEILNVTQEMKLVEYDPEHQNDLMLIARLVTTNSPGTWGSVNSFQAGYTGFTVGNLNQFSVLTSVSESGVTAGKNRVTSVDLLQVRCIHRSGAVQTLVPSNGNAHTGLTGDTFANTVVGSDGTILQTGTIPPEVGQDVYEQ